MLCTNVFSKTFLKKRHCFYDNKNTINDYIVRLYFGLTMDLLDFLRTLTWGLLRKLPTFQVQSYKTLLLFFFFANQISFRDVVCCWTIRGYWILIVRVPIRNILLSLIEKNNKLQIYIIGSANLNSSHIGSNQCFRSLIIYWYIQRFFPAFLSRSFLIPVPV